jgi:hypothetical protein
MSAQHLVPRPLPAPVQPWVLPQSLESLLPLPQGHSHKSYVSLDEVMTNGVSCVWYSLLNWTLLTSNGLYSLPLFCGHLT